MSKQLTRNPSNAMIAGVCAGLADYFGQDTNLIRIITILLALITGGLPFVVVYFIAWIVVPSNEEL